MMKIFLSVVFLIVLFSCNDSKRTAPLSGGFPLTGTWKLLQGTVVKGKDTTITDYTRDKSFIKIINATHFSFLQHDLQGGKDSATASFSAGGGRYTLQGNQYTETLEYCSARNWEGNNFHFTISIQNDTLIQTGVEKIADLGIEQINTEKYVRLQ